MVKFITFLVGFIILFILFIVQEAFSKPIYNKMSNVWEEDSYGRLVAKAVIIVMLIIAFFMGVILK